MADQHAAKSTLPAGALLAANAGGIARAAQLLVAGKLVILPTETVYGIGLSLGSREAREAARRLKARAGEPGAAPSSWVIHAASPEELLSWVPQVTALGRRLITKTLPGPVAFQIKLDVESEKTARARLDGAGGGGGVEGAGEETVQGGFITLRCPDFAATQEVLERVGQPVAIIGAGTRKQPGVFEVADLPPELMIGGGGEGEVAAAMEGGPTRYRRSSTLVRIEGERFSVVRAGVIDERILSRLADFTMLFICSGNTCRSPMAAGIAAKLLADKLGVMTDELALRHVVIQSAGLHAARGMRATLEAVDAAKKWNADLSGHNSQPATLEMLRRADLIFTMTSAHREEVLELLPGSERKTFRLDPDGDVVDPIGSPFPVYERVAGQLATAIRKRLAELPL